MSQIPDLWPDFVETELVTPLSILKSQGASLAGKTGNLLEGVTRTESYGEEFRHWFSIYVPSLDYHLGILRITHPLEFYPLEASAWGGVEVSISTEAEFLRWMREVFTSDKMRRTIQSLLAQVRSAS